MDKNLFESVNRQSGSQVESSRRIVVCIGTFEDFEIHNETFKSVSQKRADVNDLFDEEHIASGDTYEVNYHAEPTEILEKGFLSDGQKTYLISKIDVANKFSENFLECLSLVVSGKDRISGENVSFLTHMNPKSFLKLSKEQFVLDLDNRLTEMKERCEPDTIDAVLLGGKSNDDFSRVEYAEAKGLIFSEVKKSLDFELTHFNGPKINKPRWSGVETYDNVYFDNKNRRVYLIRPEVNPE